MSRLLTSSICRKLALLVSAAVLLAVIVASVATGIQQTARRIEAKRVEASAVAAALATAVAPSLADRRVRETARTLGAMSRMPDVLYVAVMDTKGRIIFEHGAGVVLARGTRTAGEAHSWLDDVTAVFSATHLVEAPIIHGGRPEGRLRLIADLSGLRGAFIEGLLTALLIGLAAALLGVAAALALQGAITRPIRDLSRAMREIGETKEFDRTVPRQSSDETGELVDSFNAMIAEIRNRDDALARHRETLESTVTERTRDLEAARIAAEQANAAKSEFLSTMSHEIRTPMNGMLVMAELLAAGQPSPRLQRYADIVVKSGQSLLTIIDDILDFSKIEAGRLELERIPVEPRVLLDDALELFSERALSQGLDLAGYVAPDVPERIAADPVRLNQILTNLINNALKFTEKGGVEVTITVAGPSAATGSLATLTFSVSDTGIGIPEEKRGAIFDAFSQADQSTTRRYGGTGIGLAICKRLAECMNGDITLDSKPGAGATFTLTAPFEVVEPSALPPPLAAAGLPPCVVVEIEAPLTRATLARSLADWGFEAVAAADLPPGRPVELLFADVDWLTSPRDEIRGPLSPLATAPAIVLGRMGDTRSERLCAEGRAILALDHPVTTRAIARIAAAARGGRIALEKLKAADHRATAPRQLRSFAGARVLAADDSAVNREVLAEVLKRLDVHLTSVADGQSAVEEAATGAFDLIFMDCSMPGLDGFEATRLIRSAEQQAGRPPVPVIALTAHVFGDQGDKAHAAGMSDFITKPFALATIEACLARWITPASAAIEPPSGNHCVSNAHAVMQSATTAAASTAPEGSPNPEASPPADQVPLLDEETLNGIRQISTAGTDLFARVVALYREHAPRALVRLDDLVRNQAACPDCASAAHALKSLSRNAGARRVGDLADRIERRCLDTGALPNETERAALHQALNETLDAFEKQSLSRLSAA